MKDFNQLGRFTALLSLDNSHCATKAPQLYHSNIHTVIIPLFHDQINSKDFVLQNEMIDNNFNS